MNVRPIDRRLLIHEVWYEEFVSDRTGNRYLPPVLIKRVRVVPTNKVQLTSEVQEELVLGKVFVDRIFSKPFIPFVPKSRIKWINEQGKEEMMIVDTCTPRYAFRLHHYESAVK